MARDDVRRELLEAALARRTVTYGALMAKFGFTRGGTSGESVVAALDEIDRDEHLRGGPGFAAIVVRKDTGYPGGGFFCWKDTPAHVRRPQDQSQNPKLSQLEKDYIRERQEEIWRYYGAHNDGSLNGNSQLW
jgi:hypothetical protein